MPTKNNIESHSSTKNISSIVAEYLLNEDWESVGDFFNHSEFAQHFGVHVALDNPELPRCEISDIKPFHLGGVGQDFINGAIISAVVDFSLGLTGLKFSKLGKFATRSISIDISRPIEKGRFYALAKSNKKIGNKVFSEATIYNHQDKPCVYATGMLRVGIKHT